MGPRAPLDRIAATVSYIVALLAVLPAPCASHAAAAVLPDSMAVPGGGAPDSAGTPRYRLDPVVVTAERLPVSLALVPSDVTVIDRARLDADRPFLLADALRQVPGLDVQRGGRLGKITDVRLRGADPRHTLVLFDGIPLNGPWLGSFDFADLTGFGPARVEVVGGPVSSLYGSGAVGGVIQVLSDDGSASPRLRGFAEAGSERTVRQGAEWAGRLAGAGGGLAVAHMTSDGAGRRDGYDGISALLHADRAIGAGRIRVSALATQATKDLPYDFTFDPGDFQFHEVADPNNTETDRVLAGRASYARTLGSRIALEGELSGLAGRIENRNGPNDATSTDHLRTDLDNSRGIAALRGRFTAGSLAQGVLGAEYRSEHVDRRDDSEFGGLPSVTHVVQGVHSRSLYAQGHAEAAGRLLLDAGIRLEDHSRYGAAGVPRAAGGLLLPEFGMKLRGGYGRAFTAPTLTDLFYPGYSSPTLRPERSRTWEAGADGHWMDGRLEAHVTWHTTRFVDLIQSNSYFVPANIGRAWIEGEEASMRVQPHARAALSAWAEHLVSRNLVTGEPLPKRPAWRAGFRLDVTPAPSAVLTATWRWVTATRDPFAFVDESGRLLSGDTPGYATLEIGASVPLPRRIPASAQVRLSNVLDRAYSEVRGFPAQGRALTVGLTLRP